MDTEEKRAIVRRVRDGLLITKIVCTRTVKTPKGDVFVGFSAVWDNIQEDAGPGTDLIGVLEEDTDTAMALRGLPLDRDLKVAVYILGSEVDQAAHDRALAAGMISTAERNKANRLSSNNASLLISEALDKPLARRAGEQEKVVQHLTGDDK